MSDMIEYQVTYKAADGGGTKVVFAKDRKDAIEFTKQQVRVPCKIKSARPTVAHKSKGGRKPKAKPEPVTEEEARVKLLAANYARVQSSPFSGIAIAAYLKVFMANSPTRDNMQQAIMFIIRAVEAYEDKLVQNRKVK